MSKFCIKLGTFNKILSIPFLLALTQIILIIFELYFPGERKNVIMDPYSEGLGQIAIIIIPYIKCFSISNQKEKTKCQFTKKNCLHYFLLHFFCVVNALVLVLFYSLGEKKDKENSLIFVISYYLSSKVGIKIILIAILSKLLLKYEYFIHHYISISLFLIFCVSIDLLLDNYSLLFNKKFLEIFLNFLDILTDITYLCYIKYMIDRHYHYYWNIMLSFGIIKIIIASILLIYSKVTPKENLESSFIYFLEYFQVFPTGIIISKFNINFILQFTFNALQILTIFYLSPEYILISQNVARIIISLKYGNENKYICIIFFIFQFFCLMIYLEILELNFLNLNINTKRNIKLRTNEDEAEKFESLIDDVFEVEDGYIFKNEESGKDNINNSNVELRLFEASDKQEENLL